MVHWQSVPLPWLLAGDIIDEGNGREFVTVRSATPGPDDIQYFMRLRVEVEP